MVVHVDRSPLAHWGSGVMLRPGPLYHEGCAPYMQAMDGDVAMEVHDDRSLLALQDPAAFETLGPLTDLEDLVRSVTLNTRPWTFSNKGLAQCMQAEGGDVAMEVHDDRSLLALQGPAAVETLGPLTDLDLSSFYFSHFAKPEIGGIPCYLTRTGCVSEAACLQVHAQVRLTQCSVTKRVLCNCQRMSKGFLYSRCVVDVVACKKDRL